MEKRVQKVSIHLNLEIRFRNIGTSSFNTLVLLITNRNIHPYIKKKLKLKYL